LPQPVRAEDSKPPEKREINQASFL